MAVQTGRFTLYNAGTPLRLAYETAETNYADFSISSGGDLTIAPTGGDTNITGNLAVSGGLTLGTNLPYSELNLGGNIVNADISASAEIAVSKLADGSARQLLQTDAAGTGVEWTSNVDVPGTLDVTGATSLDSTLTVAGDVSIADKIIHTGDTNTAIRFPAADTVTVETAGNEALRVDNAGRLSVGHTSALSWGGVSAGALQVAKSGANNLIFANFNNGSSYTSLALARSNSDTVGTYSYPQSGNALGILSFAGADASLSTFGNGASIIGIAGSTWTASNYESYLRFNTAGSGSTSATERMRIDSSGNVGIGTSSPSKRFVISGRSDTSVDNVTIRIEDADPGAVLGQTIGRLEVYTSDGDGPRVASFIETISSETFGRVNDMVFGVSRSLNTAATETMRITNNGYLRMASGSGGIQFNGDTAAANALDDYEEGTWTPAFTSGGISAITYTTQSGTYTKIGRQVICTGVIIVNTVTASGTSILQVTGQPFTSNDDERLSVHRYEGWLTAAPKRGNQSGGGAVNLRNDGATGTTNFPAQNITAGSQLYFSLIYTVP